ncbi:MAG: translation elongation factor Ts [Arsenophonus sp. ET-KM2-MAG3]
MSEFTITLIKKLRERTGVGMMECKKALVEANWNTELAIDNMRKSGYAKAVKKSDCIAAEGLIMAKISADSKFGALLELNCETDFVAKDATFITFANEVFKSVTKDRLSNINELKAKFEEKRIKIISKIGENINICRVKILEGEKIGCYLHGVRIGVLISVEGADNEFIKHIAMHIAAKKPDYITPENVPDDIFANEYKIQLDIAMKSGKSPKIAEKIVTGRMNKFINQISLTGQEFIMDSNKTVNRLLKEKNIKVINFTRFEIGEGIKKTKNNAFLKAIVN